MDDGVGRAAHRHVHLDGVVEGGRRQDAIEPEIVPDHFDDAAAGDAAHARMVRIAAGIDDAPGSVSPSASGDRHHGGGGAHHHAGAEGARDAALHLVPLLSVMLPARFSIQYFQTSEPEPSYWPRQLPRSIGPAGRSPECPC